jgi:hypothetical protein
MLSEVPETYVTLRDKLNRVAAGATLFGCEETMAGYWQAATLALNLELADVTIDLAQPVPVWFQRAAEIFRGEK